MTEKFISTQSCRFPARSLLDVEIGEPVRVASLGGDPSVCQRLREMGFCEFAEVCKVSHGGALVCHVLNGKVALSQRLAKHIFVETIGDFPVSPSK